MTISAHDPSRRQCTHHGIADLAGATDDQDTKCHFEPLEALRRCTRPTLCIGYGAAPGSRCDEAEEHGSCG
jgi:hypothetical protein